MDHQYIMYVYTSGKKKEAGLNILSQTRKKTQKWLESMKGAIIYYDYICPK